MGARDIKLLDALSTLAPIAWRGRVYRVCTDGRDPTQARPSISRWCDGTFDVLYTAQMRDGAIMEIYSYLSMMPVFPSRVAYRCHALKVSTQRALNLVDLDALAALGVDTPTYSSRDYGRTQAIANAAQFLGFDGLFAPSARYSCSNLMLFPANLALDWMEDVVSEPDFINWRAWKAQ